MNPAQASSVEHLFVGAVGGPLFLMGGTGLWWYSSK
jgi:hypothetical protein